MTQLKKYHYVDMEIEDSVATVTLKNSKSANILGSEAVSELTDAFVELGRDPKVRVIILRGTGDKAFMAGANIHEMSGLNPQTAEEFISGLMNLGIAIQEVPKPVIARLSGWCLGGGLEMAAACDLRIADSKAQFGMPEVEVGIPSVIHSALLPRIIGRGRASRLLMTAEPIPASTALSWGFVDEVVELEHLDATISQWAEKYKAIGPAVLAQQKRLLNDWDNQPSLQSIKDSVAAFSEAYTTGEPQKLMTALAEKL